jgi:hypothetical protein
MSNEACAFGACACARLRMALTCMDRSHTSDARMHVVSHRNTRDCANFAQAERDPVANDPDACGEIFDMRFTVSRRFDMPLPDAGRVAKRRPCKSSNRSLHHVRARTGRIDDAPSRTRLARERSASGRCTRRFEDDARRPNPCGRHASHLRIDRRRRAPTRCASTRLTHARAECVAGPARASGHR